MIDSWRVRGDAMQYRKPFMNCQPTMRLMVDGLLDHLLPMVCLLCTSACREANICPGCLAGLPFNRRACELCGLPLECAADGCCGPCLQQPPGWSRVLAPLRYEFPVDVLVHSLKFRRRLAAGRALAAAMACGDHNPGSDGGAIMIPVPLHWTRQMTRGFNQARELALSLSRQTGCDIWDGSLLRSRRTPPQAGLDAAARRRNLSGSFCWRGGALAGLPVILVDDVMTTGSTARECTQVLKAAGAGRVEVWVAARALT